MRVDEIVFLVVLAPHVASAQEKLSSCLFPSLILFVRFVLTLDEVNAGEYHT
jgi:hypothetical protein